MILLIDERSSKRKRKVLIEKLDMRNNFIE